MSEKTMAGLPILIDSSVVASTFPSSDDIIGASKLTKGPINYRFSDLMLATNNYSLENKLGEGGFGAVYKVTLICFSIICLLPLFSVI